MANTISARKATRKIARRADINRDRRSRMRTFVRKLEEAIEAGKKDEAVAAFKLAEPELAKAAGKGILHRNTASRKIARLAARVRALNA